MKRSLIYKIFLNCLILLIIIAKPSYAQQLNETSNIQYKLLVRDSLDYTNKILSINTKSNEFSPIPYAGGLIYISNKPIPKEKVAYNKIYWTKDTGFKIIDSINVSIKKSDTVIKYIKTGKTDDFTAPTSNDNDILVNYKKIKRNLNEVEILFSNFSTDQAFTYNDSSHLLIYAKKSTKAVEGVKHWELWQAQLTNGKLKHKKKINFGDNNANYIYPFINNDGSKLYFATDKKNGLGGFDIYYVTIQGGVIGSNLISLTDINSSFDEIAPSMINDTLFFSSNKVGGIGGFDTYYKVINSKSGIQNLGYPVNSEKDEVGLKKAYSDYYLTTNRNGNFDILNLLYTPVTYKLNGVLTYRNDGSLAPNHLMYLKDKDADLIIDSIRTDSFAKYTFNAKPNRNYEFTTLNGDSVYEQFLIQTIPNQHQFDYISYINGRSLKQKADSLNAIWALEQKRINDSINLYSLNTKFIVQYDFDKSIISNKEKLVLDSLIKKLLFLPKVFVSVGAFTDCIGSYKYNYLLSVKRGKAVVDYLFKNGLNKQRIIANGYSKKYTISPCITKYTSKNKSLQQSSRRAEIVLSETKKTDWATLELERGKNYYAIYNSSKVNINLIGKSNINKDSSNISNDRITLKLKNEKIIKLKLNLVKQDSIKMVQKLAQIEAKQLAEQKNKEKALALANDLRIKDSIKNANYLTALNFKRDQIIKEKLDRARRDSIKDIEEAIVKKALEQKNKESALKLANDLRIKDSIRKANYIAALNLKREQILKEKLDRARRDSTLIAQVTASKNRIKDSIAAASLKTLSSKPNQLKAQKDTVEEDMSKEEILKSLEVLAKLKLEQERIVEYLTKRINKKPILIYVNSDSVSIEIYDNGIHDNDSVSVIFNKRIVVDKQELKVNKPIKFKLKVDKDSKNNELVFVAENLGTEPPNTGVMFITEKSGRRQQVVLSTDMTHNEVIYFIRIEKQ